MIRTYVQACVALLAIGSAPLLAACPSVKFVKQQAVAAVVAAPVVAVPVYGAGYSANTSQLTEDLLRQLLEEIRQLRAELRAGQQASPAIPTKIDAVAIFEATCLKCHQTATAEKQGGGLVLYEADEQGKGQLAPLSLEQKRRITNRVLAARNMPPGKPLEPTAAKAVVDWLTASREK